MKKLIIWDFDGVIADSEKLWVSVWIETLKEDKNISRKEHMVIMENVLTLLLESFSVSDVENGNCKISLKYNDIKMVIKRIKM